MYGSDKELAKDLIKALKHFKSVDTTHLLADLRLVQQQRQQDDVRSGPALRLATNRVIVDALEQLERQNDRYSQLLQTRFIDGHGDLETADILGWSPSTIYRDQRKALKALAELLFEREQRHHEEELRQITSDMPTANYAQLFGVATLQQQLVERIAADGAPQRLIVSGIGGIGKSSLLHSAVTQIAATFAYERVLWVELDHDSMSGHTRTVAECVAQIVSAVGTQIDSDEPLRSARSIERWLKRHKALIVVDNIEDRAEAGGLLTELGAWTDPSKLLLGTRQIPERQGNSFVLPLNELGQDDSVLLIRHTADISNIAELAAAPQTRLLPIYEATGGNPLAIKLVVSLAHEMPIGAILDDLPRARHHETEQLYKNIYWRVWHSLDNAAQSLFMAMPLAGNGTDKEQLQAVTTLDDATLYQAIRDLTARSLLINQGNTFEPRYAIHRLSENFLKTEIIQWA